MSTEETRCGTSVLCSYRMIYCKRQKAAPALCLEVHVCTLSPACCLGSSKEMLTASSNRLNAKSFSNSRPCKMPLHLRSGSMTGQHLSYAASMPATAQTFDSKPLGKSKHSSARHSHPWDTHGAAKIKMVKLHRLQQQRGSQSPSTPSSRDYRQKASRKAKRRSL